MPILGIVDSSKRVSTDTGAMFPLQVVTVGASGASSVTFSNIPSTYAHLQIKYIARSNAAFATDFVQFILNSDTTSNYSEHVLFGNGTTAASSGTANTSAMFGGEITAASATASIFGAGIIDLLDYANTNKFKTSRILGGDDRNGAGEIRLQSNSWRSTTAVSSITITSYRGASFIQYSQFALYGVKSA